MTIQAAYVLAIVSLRLSALHSRQGGAGEEAHRIISKKNMVSDYQGKQ
jgi:hypothetical protein